MANITLSALGDPEPRTQLTCAGFLTYKSCEIIHFKLLHLWSLVMQQQKTNTLSESNKDINQKRKYLQQRSGNNIWKGGKSVVIGQHFREQKTTPAEGETKDSALIWNS